MASERKIGQQLEVGFVSITAKSFSGLWSSLFYGEARLLPVVALAGAMFATSALMLVLPGTVLSRLMTWDLLYNFSGAWQMYSGHVAHVDFHDPLGSLYFWPTALGFRLVGLNAFAFIAGEVIVASAMFVAATMASIRRLPLLPAIIFVVFVTQLVLMPVNVGDLIDDFTFAMSYNKYGWAALIVISLILFVPPHHQSNVPWQDILVAGALIVAMFYLKITYFLVASGELAVALLISRHIRGWGVLWVAVGAAIVVNAISPWNWAYLADIGDAIASGAVRSNWRQLVIALFANSTKIAIYVAAVLGSLALWQSGQAPLRIPLAIALLLAASIFVLSQNAQLRGLPLCVTAVFILVAHIARCSALRTKPSSAYALLALLTIPCFDIAAAVASSVSYAHVARKDTTRYEITSTNLRGLSVPLNTHAMPQGFSHNTPALERTWLSRARNMGGSHVMSQVHYLETILEAVELFRSDLMRPGAVLIVDQVNPLPYALGRAPPRGGNLWMGLGYPRQPADKVFGDVDYVLIPKFSTLHELTDDYLEIYREYLSRNYAIKLVSNSWTVLARRNSPI